MFIITYILPVRVLSDNGLENFRESICVTLYLYKWINCYKKRFGKVLKYRLVEEDKT